MKRTLLLSLFAPAFVSVLAFFPIENTKPFFHTEAERRFFSKHTQLFQQNGAADLHLTEKDRLNLLPIDSNILFPTAKTCGGCHGFDPNLHAAITTDGKDVNIYDDWRSTMMANSARDPFWRAKVTQEMLVNPAHSEALQNKCTSCHAPAGNYQSKLKEHNPFYLLSNVYGDTLGLDGVTCQICHAQSPDLLGSLNSGNLNFDTNAIRIAYGQYEFVFAPPMHTFVGITPKFSQHITDAGLCAGCHTLITASADLSGQFTGVDFIEQATYHEWLNSKYDKTHTNQSCQSCHTPELQDEIIIAANYQFLTPKSPYGVHELAGANAVMLKMLQQNRDSLGITAKPEHFDSTIAATMRMLQRKTLDFSLQPVVVNGDSVQIAVKLVNKAGHKFPSGYPSRRAWIEFEVKDENGATLFHSGNMNPDYTLSGEDANVEPHYDEINRPDQVQIYELVPADVAGNFTNVLERCYTTLKDNRLTPKGFSITDPAYDTTKIVGSALSDPDFNRNTDGTEGSGGDIVHYKIPNNGYTGYLRISAKVWYQTLPPKWMAPLFDYSSPEIDRFKTMYDAADRSPILVAEQTLDSVYVTPVLTRTPETQTFASISPNPTKDGKISVSLSPQTRLKTIRVWDAAGKKVWEGVGTGIQLPQASGVYLISVETDKGKLVRKVIRS